MIPALLVLVFTSPVDFLLQVFFGGKDGKGEPLPHKPDLSRISDGSWYHKAKGYWAESFRTDGEWWSKLCRFIIWWLCFYIVLFWE